MNKCYQFRILRNLRIDIKDRLEEYSQSIEIDIHVNTRSQNNAKQFSTAKFSFIRNINISFINEMPETLVKKLISTSKWHAQHPFPGRNTQQLIFLHYCKIIIPWVLGFPWVGPRTYFPLKPI